ITHTNDTAFAQIILEVSDSE
ncbi:holo-ACP synthase, partial [Listeria monocytogenes]|nr:holo-ACP synthase [Listeria monocytogenes]